MACGSPSSRLPRSPMCPFDRAKIDSVCASRSRWRWRSATAHGSTEKTARLDQWRSSSSVRSLDDQVGAVAAQRGLLGLRGRRRRPTRTPPARPASTPATASSNTAQCAGVDAAALRPRRGTCRAPASRAGSLPRRRRRRRAPRTGARCRRRRAPPSSSCSPTRPPAADPASRTASTNRTEPSYTSTPRRSISSSTRSFLRVPRPCTVVRRRRVVSGDPPDSAMPRDARKARTPSCRSLPSTYSA